MFGRVCMTYFSFLNVTNLIYIYKYITLYTKVEDSVYKTPN
jgi:hypothetical protein